MKITDKQVLMLLEIAKGSLNICDRKDMNLFTFPYQQRVDLINQIYNQQSDKLKELGEG